MISDPHPTNDHALPYIQYQRRPSPLPSVPVALGARSVVWGQFLPGEYEDATVRPWVKLLWGISGSGMVRIDGQAVPLPPEHIALFLPGMRHEAWAPPDEAEVAWELRWFTMDGPLCGAIVRALGLSRAGVWQAGPAPLDAFAQLGDAIAESVTPEGERLADAAAYSLLVRAVVSRSTPSAVSDPVIDQTLQTISERWSSADLGVEQLAREVGIHRSAFSRRFHAATGLSPSDYLTNLRMQSALSLLRATTLSVQEIARRCGFADPDYFARHFRRRQGVTPTAYRQDRG